MLSGGGTEVPAADQSTGVDVVTLGEAMHLLVAEPGVAMRRATTFRSSIAGAETNVAIGLARQGYRVRWLGRVGADPSGQSLLCQLRMDGVDVSAVEVDPTSYTGLLMRDGDPVRGSAVQYFRAGSAACDLSAEYVQRHGLVGARLVHVTGITPMLSATACAATHALINAAKAAGAVVSFDPNVRRKLGSDDEWRSTVGPLMAQADLVFAGADELELITDDTAADATTNLLDLGVSSVLVKHADRSATLVTRDGEWRQRPLAPVVVDTVGAGDALVSGYLGAWLREAPPAQALLAGMVTAALVVCAVTDIEGLPDAAELARATSTLVGGSQDVDR